MALTGLFFRNNPCYFVSVALRIHILVGSVLVVNPPTFDLNFLNISFVLQIQIWFVSDSGIHFKFKLY